MCVAMCVGEWIIGNMSLKLMDPENFGVLNRRVLSKDFFSVNVFQEKGIHSL